MDYTRFPGALGTAKHTESPRLTQNRNNSSSSVFASTTPPLAKVSTSNGARRSTVTSNSKARECRVAEVLE